MIRNLLVRHFNNLLTEIHFRPHINFFSTFAAKQAVLSPFRFGGGEESPDNKGHCASERGDIREGMVTEKKITVPACRDKGEKVE